MNETTTRTQRVYVVSARDFSFGHIAPLRLATADTLVAMIERCANDIREKDGSVGSGFSDMTVTVIVADLEVAAGQE